MPEIEWAKLLASALGFLKRHWLLVPMAGLAIALLVTRGTLAGREHDLAKANQKVADTQAALSITQQSLDGARVQLTAIDKDAKAAEARYKGDIADHAKREQLLVSQSSEANALIADLLAAKPGHDRCAVSPAAKKALEEL